MRLLVALFCLLLPTSVLGACPAPLNTTPVRMGVNLLYPRCPITLGSDSCLGSANASAYEDDIDIMLSLYASAGVRFVRLFVYGNEAGDSLGSGFNSVKTAQVANRFAYTILPKLKAYGMRAVVAFAQSDQWYNLGQWGISERFAPTSTGWANWVTELASWEDKFIETLEYATDKDAILFYDVQNELNYEDVKLCSATNTSCYSNSDCSSGKTCNVVGQKSLLAKTLLRLPHLPDAKRGISLLRPCQASLLVSDLAASPAVNLRFLDIHSYPTTSTDLPRVSCPNSTCPFDTTQCDLDVSRKLSVAVSAFSTEAQNNLCAIIGEWGLDQCVYGFGSTLISTVTNPNLEALTAQFFANSMSIPAVLHWMPFDYNFREGDEGPPWSPKRHSGLPEACDQTSTGTFNDKSKFGLFWNIDYPKPNWGTITNLSNTNLLPHGGNFTNDDAVNDWSVTGTSTTRSRVANGAGVTGPDYLVWGGKPSSSAAVELCSPWMKLNVSSDSSIRKYRASISGYLRSSVPADRLSIAFDWKYGCSSSGTNCSTESGLNGEGRGIASLSGSLSSATWKQISAMVSPRYTQLPSGTEYMRSCLRYLPQTECGTAMKWFGIDLDAVTVNAW